MAQYRSQLGLDPDPTLQRPESAALVEFAHTPHFGHLGFLRMMLVAAARAAATTSGVLLFCLNDHVAANALPNLRHIPMWRGGEPMRQPPRLGISGADSSRPLLFVPPPGPESLRAAQASLHEVLAFQASQGPKKLRKESTRRLPGLFDWLIEQAGQTRNLADWATRCLILWLQQVLPELSVWPLPSRRLLAACPEQTRQLHDRRQQIAKIQNEWSQRQGDWPEWSQMRPAASNYQLFHGLCASCRRCLSLGQEHEHPLEWAPKVIARQPLADSLGLELRVCGGPRGYWKVAAEVSHLLGLSVPPRLSVTGTVEVGAEPCPSTLSMLAQADLLHWFAPLAHSLPTENLRLSC